MQGRAWSAAAVAGFLALGCKLAEAEASAQVTFDGKNLSQTSSGAWSDFENFDVLLQPFESRTFTVDYSIHLFGEGLPVGPREWVYMTPTFPSYSGPDPTGFELAAVSMNFIAEGRSGFNEDIDYSFSSNPQALFEISSGLATYNGQFSITATNTNTVFERMADSGVTFGVWVDANPVPEPRSYALLLAGLTVLTLRSIRQGVRAP